MKVYLKLFLLLSLKKTFDISNEFKEYLPLLIKDQEINLNKIMNKRNIKFKNISEFKLIKSASEYEINLDEIFSDTKGKVLIKNLKHKINLLEKFDYNLWRSNLRKKVMVIMNILKFS